MAKRKINAAQTAAAAQLLKEANATFSKYWPTRDTLPIIQAALEGDTANLAIHINTTNNIDATDPSSPDEELYIWLDEWGIEGQTALIAAAYGGHADACNRLLAAGANPDMRSGNQPDGDTPLAVAATYAPTAVAKLLITSGADVNAHAAEGYCPIDSVVLNGDKPQDRLDIVVALLSGGARPDPAREG